MRRVRRREDGLGRELSAREVRGRTAAWLAHWIAESQRLSETLHDEVAPVVTSLALAADVLGEDDEQRALLREASQRLGAWLERARARNFAHTVERLGLSQSCEWLLARTASRCEAQLDLIDGLAPSQGSTEADLAVFGATSDLLGCLAFAPEQRGVLELSERGDELSSVLTIEGKTPPDVDLDALGWCRLVRDLGGRIELAHSPEVTRARVSLARTSLDAYPTSR